MPRRRTARTKAPSPKIEVPGLTVTDEMSKKEKEEQLEIYLKDFNFKVKNALRKFNVEVVRKKWRIKNFWDLHLQLIPCNLRDMTLEEFAAAGGTLESVIKHEDEKKDEIYMKIDERVGKFPAHKGTTDKLGSIDEDGSGEYTQQDEDTANADKSKRPKRARTAKAPSTVMGPPVRQSSRASKSKYATPAAGGFTRGGWGATPAVTPKFDPRLPITPDNIREMKPGERLMSIAGSPVQVNGGRRKAVGAASNVDVGEVADHLSSIYGVDLTPGRLERVLRVGGLIK
ncbi:hypothetical protein EGW08_001898 [Elysia chlorotica]|uniref:Borealin C-terminal domain-containing protein n=1 Tax=Elysia chlorotica TaxID=188477 RepID=A0A3S1BSA5_ELYCH|nr:hypothetical protein EGW08_001898 [Elysia chlorotica]